MRLIVLLICSIAICSCNRAADNTSGSFEGPLKEFFNTWHQLSTEKYPIEELNSTYYSILGKGDQSEIDKKLKEFEHFQKSIIKEVKQKHPGGSVRLPFEQQDQSLAVVSNIAILDYQFPWNTATRLSYIITFNCNKLNDNPVTIVRLEFTDQDNDVIMSSNIAVKHSGSYNFEIRPEIEFFRFKNINVFIN